MPAPDDLVVLCRTRDALQAELIRRALGDEPIACQISGSHQAGLTGILDVEVLVRSADLTAAQAVLERFTSAVHHEGEMTAELFDTGDSADDNDASDDEAGGDGGDAGGDD